MKGILLAGGTGSRLHPLTQVVSKQLLPVYDKPMIYYPLSVLMLAGIREVLLITTPGDRPLFETLLGDGSHLGMSLRYEAQPKPDGLPQAFVIGRDFIAGDPACMVLGDNIFYGSNLPELLAKASGIQAGGHVFAYPVRDPQRYGVVEFDGRGKAVSVEEKPARPRSRYALTGLYFFDGQASDIAAGLKPSPRGETEIIDMIRWYLDRGTLSVTSLSRGFAWLDTGTHESLHAAGGFVETLQSRQGLKISCIEEIAWRKGWIDDDRLRERANAYAKNEYGRYLLGLLEEPFPSHP
jgi:glucose-1-phosphate thymidylyltransferase